MSKWHYVSRFFRLTGRGLKATGRFLGEQWRIHEERSQWQRMERERLRTIAKEGYALGHGFEGGRIRAISEHNEKRRFEAQWRRDPFGARRMDRSMTQSARWLLGMPQERRKRKRR